MSSSSIRRSAFRTLSSTDDALGVVLDVVSVHPDAGAVALLEHRQKGEGIAMPVAGPDPGPEGLHRLDAMLLGVVGHEPGYRLLLASIRPTGPVVVVEDDLDTWRRLRARHDGSALELLDWFIVIGRSRALSLGELAGPPARW